jgi:hypothetical protein
MRTHLTSGVYDIAVIVDTLVTDTLGERVFDRRVVRLDELILRELYHKGRLSCRDDIAVRMTYDIAD